jgi:hypothetical protein
MRPPSDGICQLRRKRLRGAMLRGLAVLNKVINSVLAGFGVALGAAPMSR